MALTNQELVDVYRKRAKRYDFTAQLYYVIGFREWAYRENAVKTLGLKHGDTVVEIGCGTGLNFSLLEKEIGREGKIVGVDLTDAMLAVAQERVRRNGWSNVELAQSDATSFSFPQGVDGIISTFALTHVADYEKVIRAGSDALRPGGHFVILDFKLASTWISRLAPLLVLTLRPFGVTIDLAARHPWEALKKYFVDVAVHELYGGIAYIAVGNRTMAKSMVDSGANESETLLG
jgi:demethylmenaquinone methyltransferase/2-methoxy-6-polyprenyl-1,4-benzoquinol methylase